MSRDIEAIKEYRAELSRCYNQLASLKSLANEDDRIGEGYIDPIVSLHCEMRRMRFVYIEEMRKRQDAALGTDADA